MQRVVARLDRQVEQLSSWDRGGGPAMTLCLLDLRLHIHLHRTRM